jgi:spore coat polysaccharide biosynthesis predicted glycosyltransferase SpsG
MLKKKAKILFRTAGGKMKGKQLGLGHIFRCINLANELKKFCEIFFLIEDFGGGEDILKDYGFFNIKKVSRDINLQNDIKITRKQIEKINADLLVVDKYGIKKEYLNNLKKIIKTLIITDLYNIDYKADLLVNGFIGFKNRKFKNKFSTLCMIGPFYQILNSNFRNQKKSKKKFTILASFGGSDERNISELLIESLEDYLHLIKLKVILGPVVVKSKRMKIFEKKFRQNLKIQNGTKNMSKEISNARFGFCTGGLTTYEFASMGIPFAIICDDRHQLITAKEWQKRNVAINLGLINKNTKKRIQDIVEKIISQKEITLVTNRLIDGNGVSRVCNEILKITKV